MNALLSINIYKGGESIKPKLEAWLAIYLHWSHWFWKFSYCKEFYCHRCL